MCKPYGYDNVHTVYITALYSQMDTTHSPMLGPTRGGAYKAYLTLYGGCAYKNRPLTQCLSIVSADTRPTCLHRLPKPPARTHGISL